MHNFDKSRSERNESTFSSFHLLFVTDLLDTSSALSPKWMRILKGARGDLIPHLHGSKADDDERWSVAWLSLFEAVRDGNVR